MHFDSTLSQDWKTIIKTVVGIFSLFAIVLILPKPVAAQTDPMIRLIYFLPKDRAAQPDIDTKFDAIIKEAQQLYATQMENHGFGRKTFQFETDASGNAVVHHLNGMYDAAHYQNPAWVVWNEVETQLDMSENIYALALENGTTYIDGGISNTCGRGSASIGRSAGRVVLPADSYCFNSYVTSHELAHAFGLFHDTRNDKTLISNVYTNWSDPMLTSFCAAEWCDANRYFNTSAAPINGNTTIRMFDPSLSPPNAIRLRFEVGDPDGLHQAQLVRPKASDTLLIGFKSLDSTSTTVEFVTTHLTVDPPTEVTLQVIDANGNIARHEFPIDVSDLLVSSTPISIPDVNLQAAVRNALGLATDAAVTSINLLNLVRLDAKEQQITDLTGLEHAKNLRSLTLNNNHIRDLTPLSGLTGLRYLSLRNNQISDIIPLAGLAQLDYLYLSQNEISNITPLSNLGVLRSLSLGGNQISDITPLAELAQLYYLHLSRNEISNITPLSNLGVLRSLDLGGNQIVNLTPLDGLTQLETLNLWSNLIRDVAPLAGLIQLTTLNLQYNSVNNAEVLLPLINGGTDIIGITVEPAITVTFADTALETAVRDAFNLAPDDTITHLIMSQLTNLNASEKGITDLSGLEHASNLYSLFFGSNQIQTLTPLAGLTELRYLGLGGNQINDISPLAELTQLETLSAWGNQISDLTPLTGLTQLETLYVSSNQISSITPLAGLTQLTHLSLSWNEISDVTPLSSLVNLEQLWLSGNPITNTSPLLILLGQNPDVEIDIEVNTEVPDLFVESVSVNKTHIAPGETFQFDATIRNQGEASSTETTIQYYLSTDDMISTADTERNTGTLEMIAVDGMNKLSAQLTAPDTPGTYYYGVCIDAVEHEGDTTNNCSVGVSVTVLGADLRVDSVSVNKNTVAPGETFQLDTTVGNQGKAESSSTTVRYYQSTDDTISTVDTQLRTSALSIVAVDATREPSVHLTAPDTPGTYYYGVCIDAVEHESDTANNCSTSVAVTVEKRAPSAVGTIPPQTLSENDLPTTVDVAAYFTNPNNTTLIYIAVPDNTAVVLAEMRGSELTLTPVGAGNTTVSVAVSDGALTATQVLSVSVTEIETKVPDLRVESVSLNKNRVAPGETFRFNAVIRNQGEAASNATPLRYYQSTDATISTADTERNTGTLGLIAVDGMREPWAQLTAPNTPGVYYYGVCVDAVEGESDTANNCSTAVAVTVLGADLVVNSVHVNTITAPIGEKSRLTAGIKDRGGADSLDTTDRSSLSTIAPGEQFQLDVSIQNRGKADSTATTLRYYLSSGDTISSEDMEVHTATLPSIAADAMREPSVQLIAPDTPGTYYYGVCVDTVEGETDINNNCSIAVVVTVENTGRVDFVVESVRASKTIVKPGETFQISAVVGNQGEIVATATAIRYYLSTDEDISTADTEMHTATLPVIAADATRQQSRQFTAPDTPGTYYYGVCVDTVEGEDDTDNNCSVAVAVTVGGADLMIDGTPQVNKTTLTPGETFQMDTRVWNAGSVISDATTLRYYLSTDDTISSEDTEVDSDNVAALSGKGAHASRRRAELSKTLTAPDTPGTYYYGVCVDSVAGDANIVNNCSQAIAITVEAPPEPVVIQVPGEPGNVESVEIQGPDLIISVVRVDAPTIKIGGGVRFHLTLTNQGTSKAPATIIRYYRSSDATITAEDTELRAVPVGELGSGKSYTTWALLPSAFSVGTYYYGACLDGVASEFDTTNNCSEAVEIIMVLQSDPIDGLEPRGRIPVQTMKVEDSPEALSASRYFAGKVETWEASSSKPAVVTASMAADSDVVTLTPVSRGQSVVTVTARLGDTTAQQTFDVYVGIDPTLVLRWGTPVSPQTLEIGGSPLVLDLSGNVSGQVETWQASSSHDVFVSVSMTGSVVTLTPVSEGTAEVTIHASDGTVEVEHTFRVFVGAAGAPDLQWVIPVPPQTLESGGSPVVLDVSGNVAGEVETWQASSSNDAFVAVSLSGSVVTLTPVSEGTAEVTISASGGDLEVSGTFTVSVASDSSPEVSIPDEHLRTAVRSALGLAEGDTLTQQAMQRLTDLSLNTEGTGYFIALEGLEHATNLSKLSLRVGAGIKDITPLTGLTNLTSLYISSNVSGPDLNPLKLSDLSPLQNLTALTSLTVHNSYISDLTPLSRLTSLRLIRLSGNQISDLTPLQNLTALGELHVESNQISDLTPIRGITQLLSVSFSFNPISNVTPIQNLTNLSGLYLQGIPISDITFLQNLTALRYLFLNDNQISDVSPLEGLTSLRLLWLHNNQISDVTPLEGLTSLQRLQITGNQIEDLAPLRRLKENNPSMFIDININAGQAPSLSVFPAETALLPNYPNPFNPETWIPYQLAKPANVTLTIYNVKGVVVRQLALGHRPLGFYYSRGRAAHWDGRNQLGEKVASGLYFYTFTAGEFTATQKLLIRK